MKINAKYGIVAALTMAAFVAPSVGAFTATDPSTLTNSATGVVTNNATIKFTKNGSTNPTLVFTDKNYDGSTIADILDSAIIKDDDGSAALTSKVSHWNNAGLTWSWKSNSTSIADQGDASANIKQEVKASGATGNEVNATKVVQSGLTYTIEAKDANNVVATGTITITKNSTSATTATVTDADGKPLTYTGSAVSPVFTLGGIKLVAGTDYTAANVIYTDNATKTNVAAANLVKVGSYTATLVVKEGGNLELDGDTNTTDATKTIAANFTIAPQALSADKVTVDATDNDYTGKEVEIGVTVNNKSGTALNKYIADTSTPGYDAAKNAKDTADFSVSYTNNINVGENTATVAITGMNNYTGTVTKTFSIVKATIGDTAAPATTVLFTGSAITPAKVGNYTNGFTISFDKDVDHTNHGTVQYILIGDGKNIVTSQAGAKGNLTISPLDMTNVADAQVFTSTAKAKQYSIDNANAVAVVLSSKAFGVKPTIKAIYADGNEVSLSLYSVKEFTAATKEGGDAVITLTGDANAVAKGNITATGQITYKTVGASIADATISGIARSYTYNGDSKEPTPTVTLNGTKLVEGTDYVVSYKNNLNVGTATVTINGIGDYTGKVTKTFYIDPAKSSIKKVAVGAKKMTVTVKKGTKATGIQIGYRVKGTSKWSYTKTTSTSKTIKSLKKGKKYQVVVRSYTTNKSGKITNYSGWSATKTSAKIK